MRHDWSLAEVESIYGEPLLDLAHRAREVHLRFHDPREIQCCSLLSIKTGGCGDDCGYCSQSAHHPTGVEPEQLMAPADVVAMAAKAKAAGASRFCMGAAWKSARGGSSFDRVLEMVRGVSSLGLESCVTLGSLSQEQAEALKDAGLTAYNHNLDTSPEYYPEVVTTRTYEDRVRTIDRIVDAGIDLCCGGIIGMGETRRDRCALLRILANRDPHPESVPINMLVRVEGTPLGDQHDEDLDVFELIRAVATARILMPGSRVRLSAGRTSLTREAQAFCFMAGANSIFFGDQLLTTPNPQVDEDRRLLEDLGLNVE